MRKKNNTPENESAGSNNEKYKSQNLGTLVVKVETN